MLLLVAAAAAVSGCAAQRPEDPVVVTGTDVPRLAGSPPAKVIAYRYLNGQWQQVPVQVDERALIDLGTVYNQPPNGVRVLTYTDPSTFAGPDPDADARRQRRDRPDGHRRRRPGAGGRNPPNVVAGERRGAAPPRPARRPDRRLRLPLPPDRQPRPRAPAARTSTTGSTCSRATTRRTYKLDDGPNPEDSTVTTSFYSQHFSDRWADDALRSRRRGRPGVDILDRHKDLFAPGNCGRSEDTFDDGEGAFIVNKSGPVRAIRAYIGANSGPLTGRQHIFYERREDITHLSCASTRSPGVIDFFDYSPAASAMTYRSERRPRRRDDRRHARHARRPGKIRWETVDGSQGGLSIVHGISTDISELQLDLLLPRRQHPERRRRDAMHGRRAGLRLERPLDQPGDPQHRPAHDAVQHLHRHSHALLRAARQGERPASLVTGRHPAPGVGRAPRMSGGPGGASSRRSGHPESGGSLS